MIFPQTRPFFGSKGWRISKKKSDFGYLNLYIRHILGASKSGKLDDPLGEGYPGRKLKRCREKNKEWLSEKGKIASKMYVLKTYLFWLYTFKFRASLRPLHLWWRKDQPQRWGDQNA